MDTLQLLSLWLTGLTHGYINHLKIKGTLFTLYILIKKVIPTVFEQMEFHKSQGCVYCSEDTAHEWQYFPTLLGVHIAPTKMSIHNYTYIPIINHRTTLSPSDHSLERGQILKVVS